MGSADLQDIADRLESVVEEIDRLNKTVEELRRTIRSS
jgi:prefoldin subunit 5